MSAIAADVDIAASHSLCDSQAAPCSFFFKHCVVDPSQYRPLAQLTQCQLGPSDWKRGSSLVSRDDESVLRASICICRVDRIVKHASLANVHIGVADLQSAVSPWQTTVITH